MVYLHLANGFEEIEAVTVADILRRGGVAVQLVSMEPALDVTGSHKITVKADILFQDADYKTCEMMIFPGGMPGANNLMNHRELMETLALFASEGKPVAAICAAPMIFGHTGLAAGRKATIFPGMEDELKGAILSTDNVVVDGNMITSKGPATAMEFALALVEFLKGSQSQNQLRSSLLLR
jgi:4-methyl-5(b-hydroxyethyl)-thiazole monophosphate biosynthesis